MLRLKKILLKTKASAEKFSGGGQRKKDRKIAKKYQKISKKNEKSTIKPLPERRGTTEKKTEK